MTSMKVEYVVTTKGKGNDPESHEETLPMVAWDNMAEGAQSAYLAAKAGRVPSRTNVTIGLVTLIT